MVSMTNISSPNLVGGFNPIENFCSSNWIISPVFGVKIKNYLKPPPSWLLHEHKIDLLSEKPLGFFKTPLQIDRLAPIEPKIRTTVVFHPVPFHAPDPPQKKNTDHDQSWWENLIWKEKNRNLNKPNKPSFWSYDHVQFTHFWLFPVFAFFSSGQSSQTTGALSASEKWRFTAAKVYWFSTLTAKVKIELQVEPAVATQKCHNVYILCIYIYISFQKKKCK